MTRTTKSHPRKLGTSPACSDSSARLFIALVLFASTATSSLSYAEAPPTSGEIEIEEMDQKRRPTAAINQQEATQFVASIQRFAEEGGKGSPVALTDGAAQHLSVLYLYCLHKL